MLYSDNDRYWYSFKRVESLDVKEGKDDEDKLQKWQNSNNTREKYKDDYTRAVIQAMYL
jgi:hypothetical protein